MDNIPHGLSVYNRLGKVSNEIILHNKKHLRDARIIWFAYSEKEMRIGATNNDYSMAFWDFSDNFKYEKWVQYDNEILKDQIFYIEFWSKWLTVDQDQRIHIIDIDSPDEAELLTEVHE